jgi:hypothetical protein
MKGTEMSTDVVQISLKALLPLFINNINNPIIIIITTITIITIIIINTTIIIVTITTTITSIDTASQSVIDDCQVPFV